MEAVTSENGGRSANPTPKQQSQSDASEAPSVNQALQAAGDTDGSGDSHSQPNPIGIKSAAMEKAPVKTSGNCEVCAKPSELLCNKCCLTYYCSREHQKKAWKNHKKKCYPVRRVTPVTETEGPSQLVASRDISQGEVFLKEFPMVIYPYSSHPEVIVCLECCSPLPEKDGKIKVFVCWECGWEHCSEACRNLANGNHKRNECPVFQKWRGADLPGLIKERNMDKYLLIGLIRTLLVRNRNPELWTLITGMDSFRCDMESEESFGTQMIAFATYVLSSCKQPDHHYDLSTIAYILGVLGANAVNIVDQFTLIVFDIRGMKCASALFPVNPHTARNCIPNAHWSLKGRKTGGDLQLRMIANVPIPKGSSLNFSIDGYGLHGTFKRRELKKEWGYYCGCHCERCKDPTELGTNISALKCKKCVDKKEEGYCLQINPDEENSPWKCNNCEGQMPHKEVLTAIKEMSKELDSSLHRVTTLDNVKHSRELVSKLKSRRLHPNHYLIINAELGICKRLVLLRFMMKSEELAQQGKMELVVDWSKHILSVADVLTPGYSRLRGQAMYFLQFCMVYTLIRIQNLKGVPTDRTCYSMEPVAALQKMVLQHRHTRQKKDLKQLPQGAERQRKERLEECKQYQEQVQKMFELEPEDSEEQKWLTRMNRQRAMNYSGWRDT